MSAGEARRRAGPGLAVVPALVVSALAVAAAFLAVLPARAGPPEIAVFPFELNDTSGEPGDHAAEQAARLALVTREAETWLAERGAVLVDVAPFAARLEALPRLWQCNGCEAPLAREAGAQIALTGMVHKVSTLIQSILIVARDAETGTLLGTASVSIRGDTDEAWTRGVRYILKRGLLGEKVMAGLREPGK